MAFMTTFEISGSTGWMSSIFALGDSRSHRRDQLESR